MQNIFKGQIEGFYGSWGSGMALLKVKDLDTKTIKQIPCENGSTVRALESAFGGVITNGHSVDNRALKGQVIYYTWDDMGLMLAGFMPEKEASDELVAAYEDGKESNESR